MDFMVQRPGTIAPPCTPLAPANPSMELERCFSAYERAVLEYGRYSIRLASGDFQRDCERKSCSMYEINIWKIAIGLNRTAIMKRSCA